MKLVVGLGNPGRKYQQTRHNVGFDVVAELARRWGDGQIRSKYDAEIMEASCHGTRLLLVSPLTYMNLSGSSVQPLAQFYKTSLEDLLVVCDCLSLPLGKLRVRANGSAGGQKGLADIIRRLGTNEFARVRIGIGIPPDGREWSGFVLSKFSANERKEIDVTIQQAADAVELWVKEGVTAAMNRYN